MMKKNYFKKKLPKFIKKSINYKPIYAFLFILIFDHFLIVILFICHNP